jgi:heme-degrading monooxygenase HmoA
MIARVWQATAGTDGAAAYRAHFAAKVLPELASVPGHRGAYLLEREDGDQVVIQVLTLWESFDAIKGFAGPDLAAAVVEPEARAVLDAYDDRVVHHHVVVDTVSTL